MILGIGTDLCNIERIERTLARFGDRFRNRVFTELEQRRSEARADTPGTYAKRWAAKEACSKALGTGLRMGIAWRDMGVANLRSGQPEMRLTGWAAARLAEMTPAGLGGDRPRHADRRSPLGAGIRGDRGAPRGHAPRPAAARGPRVVSDLAVLAAILAPALWVLARLPWEDAGDRRFWAEIGVADPPAQRRRARPAAGHRRGGSL